MYFALNIVLVSAWYYVQDIGLYLTLFPFDIWTLDNQDEWKTRANLFLLLTFMINLYIFFGDDTYYNIR